MRGELRGRAVREGGLRLEFALQEWLCGCERGWWEALEVSQKRRERGVCFGWFFYSLVADLAKW